MARLKRQRAAARQPVVLDRHAEQVLRSMDKTERWLEMLLTTNAPGNNARAALEAIAADLATSLQEYDEFELCELLRVALLPWSIGGEARPGTERGPALVELLMLIALSGTRPTPGTDPVDPNSLVEGWQEKADHLLTVAQIEVMAQAHLAGAAEALTKIQLSSTFREVWIRNSSYPDMVSKTFLELFGTSEVESAMKQEVGFTATEALCVLDSVHELQVGAWNRRLEETFGLLDGLMASGAAPGQVAHDDPRVVEFRRTWENAWNAKRSEAAVSQQSIATDSGVPADVVKLVIDAFSLSASGRSAVDLVHAFASGDNPWRTNPILAGADGSVMLIHDAMNLPAVRENSEQLLRDTPAWEKYQAHRGKVLEDRVREAFDSLMPGASVRASYEYFVPADEGEGSSDPCQYTKRVEGDLLVVLDDVAVIVESKAIATNPKARAGDTRKLRRDLVGMIGNASKQAARTADRIRLDGGLRLHGEGWLDLSGIREIHLVAVSLDDLSGVATAASDLIDAGILGGEEIPWTVSLHDLQIIADLVDTPAEFLLYLRRRRDAETAHFYMAPDELDLFLYFFEAGLYVPPDPVKVQDELPFMRPDTAGYRKRAKLGRQLITSRTDPLDKWHWSVMTDGAPPEPKPTLLHSPMKTVARELEMRRDFGWLSIGATLLSGSTKAQADMCRHPKELLRKPDSLGRERSMTVPVGATKEDAWLLVWITRPRARSLEAAERHARSYLHAKKYQLGIRRGVALQYSEETQQLEGVFYEGARLEPDPDLDEKIKMLVPPDRMSHRAPPQAKRHGRSQ